MASNHKTEYSKLGLRACFCSTTWAVLRNGISEGRPAHQLIQVSE